MKTISFSISIKSLALIVVLVLSIQSTWSQKKELPQITNLKATVKKLSHEVAISFNVNDSDNEQITLDLNVFYKGTPVDFKPKLSKDARSPVKRGGLHQFVWHYPDSINDIHQYSIELVADDQEKVNIQQLVDAISIDNIRSDVATMSKERYYETENNEVENLKRFILERFRLYGAQSSLQKFEHGRYKAHNVLGVIEGTATNKNIFVVGAHFDAVKSSPGANDNASGIAGVLEAVRVLSKYKFHNSLHFVAFDLEEVDLLGSKAYVEDINKHHVSDSIGGMINLDMIGYFANEPGSQIFPEELKSIFPEAYSQVSSDGFKGDFILNTGNEGSVSLSKIFDHCARKYSPDLEVVSLIVPDNGNFAPDAFRASDHARFWDANYRAISVGDTGNVRNPFYHSSEDKPEKINYIMMTNVIRATVATLAELGVPRHCSVARCRIE